MFYPFLTATVTLLAMILYFVLIMRVGMRRGKLNIPGTELNLPHDLAVAQRVQINTTEHLVLFLPLLWMAASLSSDGYAACVGAVWVLGRIVYAAGYTRSFAGRTPGLLINVISYLFLAGGIVWGLIQYARYTADITQPPM